MKIGIISAMEEEHLQLASRLSNGRQEDGFVVGDLGPNRLILKTSGIGKVNAALTTQELIKRYQPDCVINSGVAGGIDSCLAIADVVVADRVVYHDVWCGDGNEYGQVQGLPTYFKTSEVLLRYALALNEGLKEGRIHGGLICTGDQFVSDEAQLAQIKQRFPEGLAVDMESAAIAQTCYLLKVPFISFRLISDTPGAEKENFAQYRNFWATIAERSYQVMWKLLQNLPETLA